jgi:hypothetical protein
MTIVRNCALMQLRKRTRQIHFPLDEPFGEEKPRSLWKGLADERPTPEDEYRNFELTTRLRKCTAMLTPTLRRTFQLRVVDGLSVLETAPNLGTATRNGQGAAGTCASKNCTTHSASACTELSYTSPAAQVVRLVERRDFVDQRFDYFDLKSYPFITYNSKAKRYPRRYVAHSRCRVDGLLFR